MLDGVDMKKKIEIDKNTYREIKELAKLRGETVNKTANFILQSVLTDLKEEEPNYIA